MPNLQLRNTSGSIHRPTQFFSALVAFYLLHKRHALDTVLLAAGRGVTKVAVTTLGAAARAHDLNTVAVRAGKGVVFLYPTVHIGDYSVTASVK
jgi:hypothetical protein